MTPHVTVPVSGAIVPAIICIKVVVAKSERDKIAILSPGRPINEILSNTFSPSIVLETFSTLTISFPISRPIGKLMNGYLREDGLISSKVILSNCFLRAVACFDFDALAENRATNSCSCLICSSFLAFCCEANRCASSEDSRQKS